MAKKNSKNKGEGLNHIYQSKKHHTNMTEAYHRLLILSIVHGSFISSNSYNPFSVI